MRGGVRIVAAILYKKTKIRSDLCELLSILESHSNLEEDNKSGSRSSLNVFLPPIGLLYVREKYIADHVHTCADTQTPRFDGT